ncbi:MAG TPA: hypothetical protein VFD58_17395 [Blastocatellia bacterium]|nr:hypothetical protein [Blastocatellia bacterium]
MRLLLNIHSIVRWLVVLAAVLSVVVFAVSWLNRERENTTDRKMMAAFLGLLDTQVLLGIILLVWFGVSGSGFLRYRLEHAFTMLLAVVLGHVSARWKNADAPVRARNYLLVVLGVLLLIWVGVSRLPQGWTMS